MHKSLTLADNLLDQMGFEDDYAYSTGSYGSSTSHLDISRYALGARGIDRIEKVVDSTSSSPSTVIQYPLYDAHGNMVATLSRGSSSGTYTVGNQRAFEPWGSVFDSSGLSNTPKQAYCASLGHVADSELGLTYMRARYYEPSTGRFISEDPACDGINWCDYAHNCPVNRSDVSGRDDLSPQPIKIFRAIAGGFCLMGAMACFQFASFITVFGRGGNIKLAIEACLAGVAMLALADGCMSYSTLFQATVALILKDFTTRILSAMAAAKLGAHTAAAEAVDKLLGHALLLMGMIASMEIYDVCS